VKGASPFDCGERGSGLQKTIVMKSAQDRALGELSLDVVPAFVI